jgi:hypothetical protein
MKNKTILFLLLTILVSFTVDTSLFSQPSTVWSQLYNGPANQQDSAVGITMNSSGMVFVTGWSFGSGTLQDIATIRYDPNTGDTIWVSRYATNLEERVTSITCDNNAVYITGWSFAPTRDILTVKYDAVTGAQVWARLYPGTGNGGDYGFAIAVDASGNVYVTGRSDIGGSQKFTTLKYDAAGNLAPGWPSVYTGGLSTAFDQAQDIKVDNSGNVYVTGKSGSPGTEDFLTLRINSGGTVDWAKKYNGTSGGEDNALALVMDNAQQNIYVAGYSFRTGGVQDYFTIRYSAATGDSGAAASYNGPIISTDQITAMTIDNQNNVYVTGFSAGNGTGLDYATIKYNSNLQQQWLRRTTNSGSDFPTSIAVEPVTGNVYVTGSSVGSGTGYDYLTISYDNDGTVIWEKRENASASLNDYASGVVVSDTDRVFVTGSANFSVIGVAFYTLRYSISVGIEPISGNVPTSFSLLQNYPNPFNPSTTIRFDISKSSFVTISVFDVTGRELEVLASENVRAGEYRVVWDASKYSSGIYFYTLTAGDFRQTKKMMLIK